MTRAPWGGVNLLTRAPVGLKVELEVVVEVGDESDITFVGFS